MSDTKIRTAIAEAIRAIDAFAQAQGLERHDGLCGVGVQLHWERHPEFVAAVNAVLHPAGLKAGTMQTNAWITFAAVWAEGANWDDPDAEPIATLGASFRQD